MFPESETENQRLQDYSKAIQTICICLVISVILIVFFVISPLKKMYYVSLGGKLVCIALLGFALYRNIIITNNTQELEKSNQISSYVLSLFIVILILSVVRKMFIASVDRPMVVT
jgi:cell division protein FtsX